MPHSESCRLGHGCCGGCGCCDTLEGKRCDTNGHNIKRDDEARVNHRPICVKGEFNSVVCNKRESPAESTQRVGCCTRSRMECQPCQATELRSGPKKEPPCAGGKRLIVTLRSGAANVDCSHNKNQALHACLWCRQALTRSKKRPVERRQFAMSVCQSPFRAASAVVVQPQGQRQQQQP